MKINTRCKWDYLRFVGEGVCAVLNNVISTYECETYIDTMKYLSIRIQIRHRSEREQCPILCLDMNWTEINTNYHLTLLSRALHVVKSELYGPIFLKRYAALWGGKHTESPIVSRTCTPFATLCEFAPWIDHARCFNWLLYNYKWWWSRNWWLCFYELAVIDHHPRVAVRMRMIDNDPARLFVRNYCVRARNLIVDDHHLGL